ncbi:uncharacterized protein LOC128736585 [Sabethes cyaneus]|uniref:uncharacterized protein LOC128736585 n=1 Tax=Sabethes cyaneus TaxID=53552 RepID=UPI00237D51D1|nr:uncharacterized protein LOC128736585 [Sabethes cyaneus]
MSQGFPFLMIVILIDELAKIFIATVVACTYAIEEHQPKHRTARLVRQFPSNYVQRIQSIEYPSYNIPNPYGPGTYAFGYEIEDPATGNVQFRDEEKLQNGTVRGSYGYLQPDGSVIITKFIADEYGYRANTEIKRADGQLIATVPGHVPPTYNPVLNPNYVDPQYTTAILSHIKNQQYYPSQGLIQYPYGVPAYDAPINGNFFSNYFNQLPSNLNPSNFYNPQSTFPAILPQDSAFSTITSPFGNFINTAQTQFGQYFPQNNPFATWFNPNRVQSPQYLQQQFSGLNRPGAYGVDTGVPAGVYGDMPLQMGTMGNRIPTTKRRGITTTRRKHGYKTRDGMDDWLDDFLESRKREVFYGTASTSSTTPPTPTVTIGNVVGGSNRMR